MRHRRAEEPELDERTDAHAKTHERPDQISRWLVQLTERIGWQKVVVAMANKNARILWAVMVKGRRFDADHLRVKPNTLEAA